MITIHLYILNILYRQDMYDLEMTTLGLSIELGKFILMLLLLSSYD